MTTVKQALDRIARQCSITPPSGWAAATRPEHIELRDDFLLETIEDIRSRVDLPAPIGKQTTITGTGAESYSLPSNFSRLARDPLAVYESTTLRRAGTPITSDGLWAHINTIGSAGAYRYFAVEGYDGAYTIKFEQDLSTAQTVTVSYISNVWIVDSGGNEATEFDDDADSLILPRRAVELGTIARFRERKGFEYMPKRLEYEAYLARLANDGRTRRQIAFGRQESEYLPMRVPVPDHIPST